MEVKTRRFKDFKIQSEKKLVGEKIPIYDIFNREITVFGYTIENTKFDKAKGNGKCLYMEISLDKRRHIVFTGSVALQNEIEQIPKVDGFPFTTTIIRENKRFIFT